LTEMTTAINALLHVAQNTDPFDSGFAGDGAAVYTATKLVSGFPLGEDVEVTTVALYELGGPSMPQGLGTVKQWRRPTIRVDVLSEYETYARRILDKLRQAWINDFDAVGAGSEGDVGVGYLRVTGEIKYIEFSEPRRTDWDGQGRITRFVMDMTIMFGD